MSRRQLLIASIVGAALLAAGLLWIGFRNSDGQVPLKIGADLTLSGPTAYWSQEVQKGLDLAVDEANADTGKRLVTIVYQDNKGNAGQAVSVFQRLANIDQVSVVVTCHTPIAKPLRETAGREKVPLLATVTSALDFGMENEWSFRDFPGQDQEAPPLAEHAHKQMGLRKIGSLIVNDDYGRDGDTAFRKEFTRLGGAVLPFQTLEQKDSDFRSQIRKVLSDSPEAVLVIARDAALGVAVKQLREATFRGPIFSTNFDTPDVWNVAGTAADGVVFTGPHFDLEASDAARKFTLAFRAKYRGEEPDYLAVYGYSIGRYLISVLREADGDRDKVRQALGKLSTDSVRGRLIMNAKREVISPIGLYEVRNGKQRLIRTID